MHLHFFVTLFVLAGLSVSLAAGDPQVGTAQVNGPVLLNGHSVSGAGIALRNGDKLQTSQRGGVLVTISGRDELLLDENSGITLRSLPDGVSAELDRGRLLVTSAHQGLREVRLAGEAVSIRAAPGVSRSYQVSRLSDATYVLARKGSVSIFDEGYATHEAVAEGHVGVIRPEAEALTPLQRPPAPPAPQQPAPPAPQQPAPSASGQRAGQISVAIPKDYIVRGTQETEGNRGDPIFWNDLLRTEPRGRVRALLEDGSILNLGSDSRLQVVQHDAKSQQTNLEMRYGRLRAQVVALTRPSARFEIRTNTAICGVLGTDFYIEATEKTTRVIVFRGVVKVTPLAAGAVAGLAGAGSTVNAGSTVTATQASTAVAGSVSAPATATAAQVQTALTVTTASTQAAQVAAVATTTTATTATRVAVVTATAAPAATSTVVAAATIAAPPPASPSRP
jgi:ferric-dicitrate binding protein FerR (iron transport regulator)